MRGSASTEIEGLGATLEEVQANAENEGKVNLVSMGGLRRGRVERSEGRLGDRVREDTGCDVSKGANTSDEMVTLMETGQYDGVSASGNATLRLDRGR